MQLFIVYATAIKTKKYCISVFLHLTCMNGINAFVASYCKMTGRLEKFSCQCR